QIAVAGKRQGTDTADATFSLPRIVGVERRDLETLDELARLSFPNADGAMPIGAGQVLPIRADGHDVKRGGMALRRSLVVALQRSYRPTRLSIPQFDKHIVAGGDQQVAVWRDDEIAHPACVSIHASLRLAVAPPDQLAVEAGRDKERFHNDDG